VTADKKLVIKSAVDDCRNMRCYQKEGWQMVSQVKFAFLGHSEHLFRAILESAGSGNRLDRSVPLYLNLRVLFPSANVRRHVVKHDFFFEEFVHLALNRILVARLHEGGRIVNASHSVKVFVLA